MKIFQKILIQRINKKIIIQVIYFILILSNIFVIVALNKFHLEYPIGRGGFGKVNHIK